MRQLIGPDAYLLELLKRLFPVWIHKPFEIAFTRVNRQQRSRAAP